MEYNDILKINLWCQKVVENNITDTYLRDKNLLLSIPNNINQSFNGEELYKTIFDKSAYLWYALSKYHCFLDGNKRTALIVTLIYLILNGYNFKSYDNNLYNMCINIASTKLNINEISNYILENTVKFDLYINNNINNILNMLKEDENLILILEKLSK